MAAAADAFVALPGASSPPDTLPRRSPPAPRTPPMRLSPLQSKSPHGGRVTQAGSGPWRNCLRWCRGSSWGSAPAPWDCSTSRARRAWTLPWSPLPVFFASPPFFPWLRTPRRFPNVLFSCRAAAAPANRSTPTPPTPPTSPTRTRTRPTHPPTRRLLRPAPGLLRQIRRGGLPAPRGAAHRGGGGGAGGAAGRAGAVRAPAEPHREAEGAGKGDGQGGGGVLRAVRVGGREVRAAGGLERDEWSTTTDAGPKQATAGAEKEARRRSSSDRSSAPAAARPRALIRGAICEQRALRRPFSFLHGWVQDRQSRRNHYRHHRCRGVLVSETSWHHAWGICAAAPLRRPGGGSGGGGSRLPAAHAAATPAAEEDSSIKELVVRPAAPCAAPLPAQRGGGGALSPPRRTTLAHNNHSASPPSPPAAAPSPSAAPAAASSLMTTCRAR